MPAAQSRHWSVASTSLLPAKTGLMHCPRRAAHSIAASAVVSSDGGIIRPSALAVLRSLCPLCAAFYSGARALRSGMSEIFIRPLNGSFSSKIK